MDLGLGIIRLIHFQSEFPLWAMYKDIHTGQ